MKSDIEFPEVKGVSVAVARQQADDGTYDWHVYLINRNDYPLETVLVASKGYGEQGGEPQRTSTLRHLIEKLAPQSVAVIERIQPEVFHLYNEYWVSYYRGEQIFDKKFLFVPESLIDSNLRFIPELEMEGVLHG